MTLHALVFALMAAISPRAASTHDARAIADAISTAVAEDAARGYVDAPLEAAAMVRFAWDESRFRVAPPPWSWDAHAHRVCGAWQLACAYVESHSVVDQAREWLRLVHAGGLSCVAPDASHARARLSLALGMIERVTSADEGEAEAQRP